MSMHLPIAPSSILLRSAGALVLLVGLAGCVSLRPLAIGATTAEVRAAWGTPTTTARLPAGAGGGERWAYSSAPEGRTVQILHFDAAGKLTANVQGLTPERVAKVTVGQTADEVEALIGPSYWSLRYPFRQDELVHVYRFMDGTFPTCFYVGYDASGRVSSTGSRDEDRPERGMLPGRPC